MKERASEVLDILGLSPVSLEENKKKRSVSSIIYGLVEEILNEISTIENPVFREISAKHLSEAANLSEENIIMSLNKKLSNKRTFNTQRDDELQTNLIDNNSNSLLEDDFIRLCLNENKDIVKMPNEVPLTKIKFENLNEPSKVWVRKYFTALCKETLGRVRGKFSGVLKVPDAELTMDYTSLLSEASSEKEKLITELSEYLMRLNSKDQLERKAQEAENLNKSLSYRPLGFYVI